MNRMITILGPTASGKTPVAAHLAAKIGGEIISADSRQVYRRMDIGTGKDLDDYTLNIKDETFLDKPSGKAVTALRAPCCFTRDARSKTFRTKRHL